MSESDRRAQQPGAHRRLSVLRQHMDSEDSLKATAANGVVLQQMPCSSEQVETVDAHTMECFIDQLRPVKAAVYAAFIKRPELLPPVIEGMRKSEHRQLVRDGLACIIDSGIEPLTFFDQDVRRYIYMAEICAPIDLSMVRLVPPRTPDELPAKYSDTAAGFVPDVAACRTVTRTAQWCHNA